MYIWKTASLAKDIKENNLTDEQWKNYYLAGSILLTLSTYLINISPRMGTSLLIEMLVVLAVILLGINITFNTNIKGGGSGSDYIARVTALSLPILIKVYLLAIIFGVCVGALEVVLSIDKAVSASVISVFTILIQVLVFWRINTHLKAINA